MNPKEFVHLHVHSHFSLLDGACTPASLAKLAKAQRMKACALTDHGNLYGAIQFYRAMTGAGIKPIIGYEAYVAPGSRKDKQSAGGGKEAYNHLTLLAADIRGYHNLVKLASSAFLDGFYYRPRIDVELLQEHKDGLIVMSGCNSGEICQWLLAGKPREALAAAGRYADLLGKENFFIEMQDNGLPEQKACLEGLARVASEAGLEMVATNDIHYGAPDDAAAHEVLLCINTGKTLADEGRMRFGSKEFYFKTGAEMAARFGHLPRAIENSVVIAERCNVAFDFETRNFPRYTPPDGLSAGEYLRKLCEEGLKRRYGASAPAAKKRLDYELGVIEKMGYSSYFLIGWDIVAFARRRGIPVGLRGSCASTLVAYVLDISDVDPIRYSLIFERALDPQRREPPDLDLDLCEIRREEVIHYLREKYGESNTAQIITFGTMKARAVVRDVGRVLGWSVSEVDALAKRIPGVLGATLEKSLEQDESLRNDEKSNPRIRELLTYARKLEGLARHASTHAAGVVIADKPLVEFIPLCKMNDVVMSQFAMNDLEKAGMLKMDLLGLRTLTIVDKTLDLVKASQGHALDLQAVPLDDAKTYELIGRGDTKAVFQFGSSGIRDLLRRLKPENMEDLIAVVAMYRPGPLKSGMVDDFIARRHGEKEVTYVAPQLEPILKETCGVIVYQEQIMRILHELGGLTLADALSCIKSISKKRSEEVDARAEAFLKGAQKKHMTAQVAEELFALIRHFAEYGFNKAHATAYAYLAYRTAYLKANYPMEFAAADLSCEMGDSERLKEHVRDCMQMGLTVLPPCVNEGGGLFTVCGEKAIRFGMVGVKSVGERTVEAIVRAREAGGRFTSLQNFCDRVDSAAINRQAAESLIKAGAFDSLPGNRAQKIAALEDALRSGARAQLDRRRGQKSLFGGDTGVRAVETPLPPIPEWPPVEMGRHEKEALGLRLSFNPLDRYEAVLSQLATATAATLRSLNDGAPVIVGGEVISIRPTITKGGHAMAHIEMEDPTGTIRGVVFPDCFEKHGGLLKEDAILFAVGTVDKSSDRPGIKLQELIPVAEAPARLASAVKLSLQRAALNSQVVDDIKALCQRHRGDCAVLVEVVAPDQQRVLVKAGRELAVRPTEAFIAEMGRLVGEGHMQLSPRKPQAQSSGNGRGRWSRGQN
ncbi:MAG: DNA polymerase III subunit alpha [Candidatus Brocadiia bacterium]